jgi:hypothetical protein
MARENGLNRRLVKSTRTFAERRLNNLISYLLSFAISKEEKTSMSKMRFNLRGDYYDLSLIKAIEN